MFSLCVLTLLGAACALPNFTGYVVVGQWDGRTAPDVQWALDVTRQDTEFRVRQELKLQQLIPTTPGPALTPTWTAYDEKTRQYFVTVYRNSTSASLFGSVIADDVESNVPLDPVEVRYSFPEEDATMVGLEAWNNNSHVTPLSLFADCSVWAVDPATGTSKPLASLCDSGTRKLTTAMTLFGDKLYVISQAAQGLPARNIVTLDLATMTASSAALAPLRDHNEALELPFEMVWLDQLNTLLVFYSGNFDQMVYVEPNSGLTALALPDLTEWGQDGHFEFLADERLEADDLWGNVCMDVVKDLIYFQCSDVDDSGDATTTLCKMPIPKKTGARIAWINAAIWPMTYGYAGMQYVQVME